MRLTSGVSIPPFVTQDVEGNEVSHEDFRGKRLWLILARFAACPFCSLRLQVVAERFDAIHGAGVEVLVVFPSPERRVRQYIRKYEPRFRVASDPEQKVFEMFGSETSWAGELRTAINLPKVFRALSQARMNPLAMDGPMHRMPSEYLVEADGRIAAVHYGEELDDGFPVADVMEWARSEAPSPDLEAASE